MPFNCPPQLQQVVSRVDWKKLKPEEKVNIALSMVDLVTSISAENERTRNPRITEKGLMSRLRRRFQLGRRTHSGE